MGIDEPGPVLVVDPAPSLSISCLTSAKRAISMANATRVNVAAKNETRDAISVTIRLVESARENATSVAAVAARRNFCLSGKKKKI